MTGEPQKAFGETVSAFMALHKVSLSLLLLTVTFYHCVRAQGAQPHAPKSCNGGGNTPSHLSDSLIAGRKIIYAHPLSCGKNVKRILVILIGGLRFTEATSLEMPFLSNQLNRCPVGLMSRDCRRREKEGSVYVTIALGTRSAGNEMASLAFNLNDRVNGELAREAYRRIYGKAPSGDIVHLGWSSIARLNGTSKLRGLGWALKVGNTAAAFIGGRNFSCEHSGYGACLLADEDGCIMRGVIDEDLCRQVSIGGYFVPLTDVHRLKALAEKALKAHRFVAVEIDDALCVADAPSPLRRYALNHVDRLIQMLFELCNDKGAYTWLVVPLPPSLREPQMTLVAALSQPNRGLLISETTKWLGIISATDLAATWLHQFGLKPPPHMTGHVIHFAEVENALKALLKLNERTMRHFVGYAWAILGVAVLCALTLITFGINAAFKFGTPSHLRLLQLTALMSLSTPLSLLTAGAFEFPTGLHIMAFIIVTSLIIGMLAVTIGAIRGAHMIAAVMLVLTAIDCAFGGSLLRNSFIGYTPINGWRFYGLGNEVIGALIPCSALTLSWLLTRDIGCGCKLAVAILFWLSTTAIVSAPVLGANFGGAMSIGVALAGLSAAHIQRSRGWILPICASGVSLILVPLMASALELTVGEAARTHIGELLMQTRLHGLSAVYD
ncbi:MAG: hypothetical protein N2381_09030, partial [Armatimonadetes bacterium]|nr:hypothetical protein [Armatimonadota bacterium]